MKKSGSKPYGLLFKIFHKISAYVAEPVADETNRHRKNYKNAPLKPTKVRAEQIAAE